MWRGIANFKLNRFREAEDDLRRCTQIDEAQGRPNPEVLCMLAACYHRLERWGDAVRRFEQAFKIHPEIKGPYEPVYAECKAKAPR
jgi:Flp pilus assembly protein TadD